MRKKCVVVHAGARDHYELALALMEQHYLQKLVTEAYAPDLLAELFPRLAKKRYKKGISSGNVSIATGGLFAGSLMFVNRQFDLNRKKDMSLSKKAYAIAKGTESHLFCYSYYAGHSFTQPPAFSGQKKLLFQLHPHPKSVKAILDEELIVTPVARNSILYENEMQYPDAYLEMLSSESTLADKVAVASNYTRRTLIEYGVSEEKITVIPYGIDKTMFRRRIERPANKNLKIIFVGSMVQRKGLSYLLDAVSKFKTGQVDLVLCGRGFIDNDLLKHYNKINISVKQNLSTDQLLEELHRSDLFVLPTLSEGFAHVVLEAMASGLPVLTTNHSCGPDIITEGKDGWILSVKSVSALVDRLEWSINNKSVLFEMGQEASKTASNFTWEKFRRGIVEFYESVIPD